MRHWLTFLLVTFRHQFCWICERPLGTCYCKIYDGDTRPPTRRELAQEERSAATERRVGLGGNQGGEPGYVAEDALMARDMMREEMRRGGYGFHRAPMPYGPPPRRRGYGGIVYRGGVPMGW